MKKKPQSLEKVSADLSSTGLIDNLNDALAERAALNRDTKYLPKPLKGYVSEIGTRNRNDSGYPVYSVTNSAGFVPSEDYFKKQVFSKNTASYKIVPPGSFAYNPSRINVGSIDYLRQDSPVLVSPLYIAFRTSAVLHPSYLKRFLLSKDGLSQIDHHTQGAVRDSLKFSGLQKIEIPLPPLDEQRRIAAVLDKADALRHQRQESLQLTEKLLQSIFIDMFGDPTKNRLGFPQCTIGDLLTSANYGTSAKAGSVGRWPVLRMGNITYEGDWNFSSLKYMELAPKEEQKYLVHQNEILFNRTNSKELVGKTAVYREQTPMAYAGYLIRCIANEHADPEYISAFLNSAHGKKVLNSMCKSIVGMANINAKELQSIPVLKPPVELQKRFGETIRSVLSLRRVIKETSLDDASLFSSLQQRAFRGELDLSRLVLDTPEIANQEASA